MHAYKIIDVKDFMSKLLIGEAFDLFCVIEATITTYCTFSIDGKLRYDYFDTDNQTSLKENHMFYSTWKDLRPYCFSIIKGKRTPSSFKLVFQLPYRQTEQILKNSRVSFSTEMVTGLYINVQFRNNELFCTTGTALKTFSPDKSLEQLWDSMLPEFLGRHQIAFEEA